MEVDMHLASLRVRFSQVGTAASQDWPDLARHTVLQLRNVEVILQVCLTTSPYPGTHPPARLHSQKYGVDAILDC